MKYFFLLILKKRTNFALRKSIKKKIGNKCKIYILNVTEVTTLCKQHLIIGGR